MPLNKKYEISHLKTKFENNLKINSPWQDYPRPQLVRESYFSLNGKWRISNKKGKEADIIVPFPPESRISGVMGEFDCDTELFYTKEFILPEGFKKEKVIIHFGAIDQFAKIFLNGNFVCEHHGGYLPFEADISEYLNENINILKVYVKDTLSSEYPYGKQREKRGGMWYTPISGIWQSVWIESVAKNYIESIRISPTLSGVNIEVFGGTKQKEIILDDKVYSFEGDSVYIEIDTPILWTPENPHLYYFVLKSGEDEISSYFALRTVSVCKKNNYSYIALNNKPYFFHGVLDQGYFSDGIYLPSTAEGYKSDILNMKKLGFKMKEHDPSRIWDTTSGWFKTFKSDVKSVHVYFKPIKLKGSKNRPLILSEFGGYSCKIKDHSFNLSKTYGYRFYDDMETYEKAIEVLYNHEVIPSIKNGLCGCVLTQLSDVEDETNGIVSFDREIIKLSTGTMLSIKENINKAFEKECK